MRTRSQRRRVRGGVAILGSLVALLLLSWPPDRERAAPAAGSGPRPLPATSVPALSEEGPSAPTSGSTLAPRGRASGPTDLEGGPRVEAAGGTAEAGRPGDATLVVQVRAFDAVTGREVPGVRWREPIPDPARADDPPSGERPWRRNGASATLAPPWSRLEVESPEGWLYFGTLAASAPRARRASSGALLLLLYPEQDVRAEILGPDGRPAEGATISAATVAGLAVLRPREEWMHDGTRRLRGVPYVPRETLFLVPHWDGGAQGRASRAKPPREPSPPGESEEVHDLPSRLAWNGPMPEGPGEVVRAVLHLEGSTELGDHNETDNDLPTEDSLCCGPDAEPPPVGKVRLRLLDRAGAPVARVRVEMRGVTGTTDGAGRVALEGVEQGAIAVRVLDPGWTFPASTVEVSGGEVTEAVLRELVGGEVDVEVRDEDGHPVPFAALDISPTDGLWIDVDDAGVQRIDPYVNADGRRILTHLPPGPLRIRAWIGTRAGQAEVEVSDRARRALSITVTR